MRKLGFLFALSLIGCSINGCGGSSSVSAGGPSAGSQFDIFAGTLPDGSQMNLEIGTDTNGEWSGGFAVAAETGPYAYQEGAFFGTVDGAIVSANCRCDDGTVFTLSGKALSNGTLLLTRSDIPGTTLTFHKAATPAASGSTASCTFSTMTTGTLTLSTTPVSSSGVLKEYRGSWVGLNVTARMYESGAMELFIYASEGNAAEVARFQSVKLTDLGKITATPFESYVDTYNPKSRKEATFTSVVKIAP